MFFQHGFAEATIEQIALAAGTRRSTLYTHFRDKDQILAAIARDYIALVREVIASLPSPAPTRAEIDAWIKDFAAFAVREKTPTVLLVQMGHTAEVPEAVREFGLALLQALAARLPAFARALSPGPEMGLARARARAVLRELGWALHDHVRRGEEATADQLTVAGEWFEHFVNGPR
jgi:AcrR family transcriptional regulator